MRDTPAALRSLADYATEARPVARLTDEARKAIRDAADEIEHLRALLSAYVADETRFNRGEGEPYGTITTETGMRARAALR